MLPGATVGLLFGVWLFQQQPRLWSLTIWAAWFAALALLGLLRYTGTIAGFSLSHRYHALLRKAWMIVLIAALGFAWAQARAWWRLQEALPAACEQQVISVQGVIVSVPERDARGQHVDFAIERSFNSECPIPARVRLHLYEQAYREKYSQDKAVQAESEAKSSAQPRLQAGERWQFSVKLKRPHATRNPHGFDYAAWCLANKIGASGSIVSKAPMQRVSSLAWQPAALIAHWRSQVGERIQHVLGITPSSAVLRA